MSFCTPRNIEKTPAAHGKLFFSTDAGSPLTNQANISQATGIYGDSPPLVHSTSSVEAPVAVIDYVIQNDPGSDQSVLPGDCITYTQILCLRAGVRTVTIETGLRPTLERAEFL